MYSSSVVKQVLKELRNGKSILQISTERNIAPSTISTWRKKYYKKKKISKHNNLLKEQIIHYINEKHASTEREIEKHFGYNVNALHDYLVDMLIQQELQSVIFPSCGKKTSKFFSKYQKNRLYYITKEGLSLWVEDKLPDNLPLAIRKSITISLKSLGLDFTTKKSPYRTISVDADIYDIIVKEAEQQNVSIKDYVNNLIIQKGKQY